MPRFLKVVRRWLAFAFLFAVLLLGTVAILLNTTAGSRFVVNRIASVVPGSLYTDGIDGTLWRTLSIRVLRYRNEKIEIDGNDMELTISWPNMFAGNIVLNYLAAGTIDTRSLAAPADEPRGLSVSMPTMPVAIEVGQGTVSEFVLQRPGGDFIVTDIDWSGLTLEGQQIVADTAGFRLAQIHFDLANVDTTLSNDVPVSADIGWSTDDATLSGAGSLAGSLAEIAVTHTLSTSPEVHSSGTVRLLGLTEPVFDLLNEVSAFQSGSVSVENGEVHVTGTIDDYEATIDASVVEPRLPVVSVSGSGSGDLSGLNTGQFDISSDYWSAKAGGSVTWRPEIVVGLDVTSDRFNPGFLDERIAGNLQTNLRFDYDAVSGWRITSAQTSGTLADFDLTAAGDLAQIGDRVTCSGCVATLSRDVAPALNATTRFEGTDQAIDIEVEGEFGDLSDISVVASINRSGGGLSGKLSSASFNDAYTGRWVLGAPFDFRTGEDGVVIDPHRWLLPEGRIDIDRIDMTTDRVSIIGTASALPLAAANAFLPAGMRLDGTASARVDVSRADGNWSGIARWEQSGTILHIERLGETPYALGIPVAIADARFSGNSAAVDSTVRVDPGVTFTSTANINDLEGARELDAEVKIDGEEWDWITALFPEIDDIGGDISADVSANGPLTSPRFGGSATWSDGNANIPALNVPLREIDLSLSISADGNASLEGAANVGDGTIDISGEVSELLSAEPSLDLSLTGDTAEMINWPEYRLWASPDLRVSGSFDGWDARGALGIPRAEINIRELPENAVTISEDARMADVDYSTSMSAARYSGEATILLGDAVHVAAFGLDTRLEGELTVRKDPDREMTLEGTVNLVDGEFEAYGQRLVIEEGTLTFTGPADDPIVDVRATRTIENLDETIVAGLHLTGRAQNINSSVYAEPSMSEADALSYLVIGRPLSEATASEGTELSGAAVRLGLRQAARITQEIGQSLGLDELTFIGDGGDATALVAGKQLNDRLYARYAYGVFSRLGMIMIRYRLSQRLSLEAGAGETQSIDLLYTVEKE